MQVEQKALEVTARQQVWTLAIVRGQALDGFQIRFLRRRCQAPKVISSCIRCRKILMVCSFSSELREARVVGVEANRYVGYDACRI
jgi:hypothetical protein